VLVDGHAHIWTIDPAAYPWQPTFGFVPTEEAPPDALITTMDRLRIAWAVLVQPSAYGTDHRFMFDAIDRHPDRFVGVGLVDTAEHGAVAAAARLVREGGCVGLRVNLALDLDRARRQADPVSWSGLGSLGVPICLRATAAHHELAKLILGRNPMLRVVIDHLELPEPGDLGGAAERIAELAAFDNCSLKIAGLARASADGPPYRDLWPLIRSALRSFGSSRLVWGSDYPAARPESGYAASVQAIASMPFLNRPDRDRVMSGTSAELWGQPRASRA
jgi:L-fuconolactonase